MQEGVIKFQMDYTAVPHSLPHDAPYWLALGRWRTYCLQHGLIGQDPQRYEGYGFGNISQRVVWAGEAGEVSLRPFVISGTQTGHLPHLLPSDYALVTACYPAENRVVARGTSKPSSESMTHGMVYALQPTAQAVIHVHAPTLWHAAERLGIPHTAADVPYGTPAMAAEVARLFAQTAVAQQGIFSMAGHEDGLVVFGRDLDEAGEILGRFTASLSPN